MAKRRQMGFGDMDVQDALERQRIREVLTESLKDTFKPEFLNRIDDVVVFNTLNPMDIRRIVDLASANLEQRMHQLGYPLTMDNSVKDHLAVVGYDEEYGARPLKRMLTKLVEDKLAEYILRNPHHEALEFIVAYEAGDVKISTKRQQRGPSAEGTPTEEVTNGKS